MVYDSYRGINYFKSFIFGLFSLIHPELPWPDMAEMLLHQFNFSQFDISLSQFRCYMDCSKKEVTILITCYTIFMVVAVLDVALLAFNGYYIPVLFKFIGETSLAVTLAISILVYYPLALSFITFEKL